MTLPLAPFGPRSGLRGMVAAADQLAASAGIGMLARGGTAADAAVATGAVMAVVGPHLCGLGGDVLAMVAPPGSAPEALLSVGRAGAGSDAARMRGRGHDGDAAAGRHPQRPGARRRRRLARPARPPRPAAARRGAGAGDRAGRGRLRSLHHAGAGEPSRPRARRGRASSAPPGRSRSANACACPGSPARCARWLATGATASTPASSAAACWRSAAATSPSQTSPDSAAEWRPPLRLAAWGHDLWTVPPPSQGYLTLAGAYVAEAAGLGTDPDDPRWAHLLVESWRAVGHDRPAVLFDGADGGRAPRP